MKKDFVASALTILDQIKVEPMKSERLSGIPRSSPEMWRMCPLSVPDQSTLVADVTDVTDGGDNKICGHSLERATAMCLSGTGGGPPHLVGGSSVCHTLKLRSW